MKILYYTNMKYAWNVQGTTKSIAEEIQKRGHEVFLYDKLSLDKVLLFIEKHKPDQLWLASSNLIIPQDTKKKIKIPIIGFGFSDPYVFSIDRFKSYDIYVTNYYETFEKYSTKIKIIYNPTACDFKFHRNTNVTKDLITMIGTTHHPRFKDPLIRLKTLQKLRKDGFIINAYGDGWLKYEKHPNNHPAIVGSTFINIINKSFVGLDIQASYSPLAHRMLEYSSCGVPTITRNRPEVNRVLEIDKEVIVYDNYDDLKEKLKYYMDHKDELLDIGKKAHIRCKNSNNITHRIDHIMKELNKWTNIH